MDIDLTIKNYRCFPDTEPARLTISEGWTALLGPNNAGKSALLRMVFELRNCWRAMSKRHHLDTWLVNPNNIDLHGTQQIRDVASLLNDRSDRPLSIQIIANEGRDSCEATFGVDRISSVVRLKTLCGHISHSEKSTPLIRAREPNNIRVGDSIEISVKLLHEACDRLEKAFYVGAYRNVLNTGGRADYFDLHVGDAFVKRWRSMQTGDNKEQNEACQRVVEVIERLLGISRLEIQASADDTTLQVSVNRKSYKLPELGAGIAQLILVLASAAAANPSYILIDEPELNLHPSLQLEFLSELAKFATHGLVFSTHSIGLARSCADAIYTVTPVAEGHSRVSRYERTAHLPELLGSLGYSSYQALGFDQVLLVEGVTEVKTLQQFIRKFKRDHRILLLPLGGSQLIARDRQIELSEVKRICDKVSVLIDSEKDSADAELAPERQSFIADCTALGFKPHVLERRAVENYFTEAAIRSVKGDAYSALKHYERLNKAKNGWSKSDNWQIAAKMSLEDIASTDLGKFLACL